MRTNYPAVVVCAIVYWLLGGLWYDVLFRTQWMALEHMSEAQASSTNPVWIWPFILTFLLNLLIAFVLAQICIWRNANTAAARRRDRHALVDWNCRPDCFHDVICTKCGRCSCLRLTNSTLLWGCALWAQFWAPGRKRPHRETVAEFSHVSASHVGFLRIQLSSLLIEFFTLLTVGFISSTRISLRRLNITRGLAFRVVVINLAFNCAPRASFGHGRVLLA